MRLTQENIVAILNAHEGYTISIPQRCSKIVWHYVIEGGKLLIYESGKLNWSDSRFDDRIDGTPIIASIDQIRRFIRQYLSY